MRAVNAWTTAAVGIVLTIALAIVGIEWSTVAIGAGATVTAGALLIGRRGGRKHYAGAGTVFCLGVAAATFVLSDLPSAYTQDAYVALVGLGSVSAVIVLAQKAGEQTVVRLLGGGDTARSIYNALAAVVGLIMMVWTVLTAYEKALRYGGVGLGTLGGIALDVIGAELSIPIWFVSGGVDATLVLFVGCTLIGFHTLESLHTTWHATKQTASAGAKASVAAGKKASSAASDAKQQFSED